MITAVLRHATLFAQKMLGVNVDTGSVQPNLFQLPSDAITLIVDQLITVTIALITGASVMSSGDKD